MSNQTIAKCATLALVAGLSLGALQAAAQTTITNPGVANEPPLASTTPSKLVSSYTTLAGSRANAESLVKGLQTGSSITLVDTRVTGPVNQPVHFTPATTRLGMGEVNITLALAKTELSKLGISNPTPAQLQAALNGGTLTAADGSRTPLSGVLVQRQSGMGWGQIAKSMGVSLGSVVSASKTGHEKTGTVHTQRAHLVAAVDKSSHAAVASHSGDGGHDGGKGNGGGGKGGGKSGGGGNGGSGGGGGGNGNGGGGGGGKK